MMDLLIPDSPFHNPQLKIEDTDKKKKVQNAVSELIITRTKLVKIQEIFNEELELAFQLNPIRKSLFYNANTFVTDIPDGTESGDYLSMDLGGTNLRLILTQLNPGKKPEFHVKYYDIELKYRSGTSVMLFDYLASCIDDFLQYCSTIIPNINLKRLPMGFVFSFGFDQLAIDKCIITQFSFNTSITDGIGKDAAQLLRESIKKKGLNVDVMAILNDTTGTLVMGTYIDKNAAIGFIIGSGTNMCYYERLDRIEKIKPETFGSEVKEVIINIECGFLGDDGSIAFAKSRFDLEIDNESLFPGINSFDKIIGGLFMGDLLRRFLISIIETGVLLNSKISDAIKSKDAISAADISMIEDETKVNSVRDLLNRLGYANDVITNDDIEIIKYVTALIGVRNALLAATTMVPLIERIDRPIVKVACDGSVYKYHPKLHRLITDFIREFVPNKKFELFLADHGSGKGAGLAAAMIDKKK